MPASVRLAAVSAVAASLFAATLPARAADLYAPPYASAYEESRYGDAYPDEVRRYGRYIDRDEDERVYPGWRFRKDEAFDPPYRRPRYGARSGECTPRRVAHARLRADGWYDFGDFLARGDVVLMHARRPSGRLFDLTIDTCSGEVIAARPLDEGRTLARTQRRNLQRY
jgi:hypothetical protein